MESVGISNVLENISSSWDNLLSDTCHFIFRFFIFIVTTKCLERENLLQKNCVDDDNLSRRLQLFLTFIFFIS